MKNENKLPEEFKAKWCAALRSGDYKQGIGSLRPTPSTYCCIGVLDEVCLRPDGKHSDAYKYLDNFAKGVGGSAKFYGLNDTYKKSFSEIADFIEENL